MATDAKHPTEDANLAVFFNVFPCMFLLSDFAKVTDAGSSPIQDLIEMNSMRAQVDGVKLGKFLFPFLEASIVSRTGIAVIGCVLFRFVWCPEADRLCFRTPGSTFSAFASHVLHDQCVQCLRRGSGSLI